jgi:hypothetical protein
MILPVTGPASEFQRTWSPILKMVDTETPALEKCSGTEHGTGQQIRTGSCGIRYHSAGGEKGALPAVVCPMSVTDSRMKAGMRTERYEDDTH